MRDFREVLSRWPNRRAVAEDCGVPYINAQMWSWRNSVPAEYCAKLAEGAHKRGIEGVTLEALHSVPRPERRRGVAA